MSGTSLMPQRELSRLQLLRIHGNQQRRLQQRAADEAKKAAAQRELAESEEKRLVESRPDRFEEGSQHE